MRRLRTSEKIIYITLNDLLNKFVQNGYTRVEQNRVRIAGTTYTVSKSDLRGIYRVSTNDNEVFVTMTDNGVRRVQRWITIRDPFDLPWNEPVPNMVSDILTIESMIMRGDY